MSRFEVVFRIDRPKLIFGIFHFRQNRRFPPFPRYFGLDGFGGLGRRKGGG